MKRLYKYCKFKKIHFYKCENGEKNVDLLINHTQDLKDVIKSWGGYLKKRQYLLKCDFGNFLIFYLKTLEKNSNIRQ
jgi:hypothetical protein